MIVTKSNISIEPSKNSTRDMLSGWTGWRSHELVKEGLIGLLDDNAITAEEFSTTNILSSSTYNQEWVPHNLKFKNELSNKWFEASVSSHNDPRNTGPRIFNNFAFLRAWLPTLKSGRIAVGKDVNVSAKKNKTRIDVHDNTRVLNVYNKTQITQNLVTLLSTIVLDIMDKSNDRRLKEDFERSLTISGIQFHYPKFSNETQKWEKGTKTNSNTDLFSALDSGFDRTQLSRTSGYSNQDAYNTDLAPVTLDHLKSIIEIAKNKELSDVQFFKEFIYKHVLANQINIQLANQLLWVTDIVCDDESSGLISKETNALETYINSNWSFISKASKNLRETIKTLRSAFQVFVEDFMFYQNKRIYVRYSAEKAIKRQLISNVLYDDEIGRHRLAKNYKMREERVRDYMFKRKQYMNVINTETGELELKPVVNTITFEDDAPVSLVPNLIEKNETTEIYSMFPKELISMFDQIPLVEGLNYDASLRSDWCDKLETEEPSYMEISAQGIDVGATAGDMMFLDQTYIVNNSLNQILNNTNLGSRFNSAEYIRYELILEESKSSSSSFTRQYLNELIMSKLQFKQSGRKKLIKALVCDMTSEKTDWQVKEIALKELTDGDVAFVPIMLPFEFDDLETISQSKSVKQANMIVFVSFKHILTLTKRAALQNSMKKFIDAMCDKKTAPMFITSRDEWSNSRKKAHNQFEIYGNKQYRFFKSKFGENYLYRLNLKIQSTLANDKKVPESKILTLFAKPKVEFEAKQKYEKMKLVFDNFNDKWQNSKNELKQSNFDLSRNLNSVVNLQTRIKDYKNEILRIKTEIKSIQEQNLLKLNSLRTNANAIMGYINPKIKAAEKMREYNNEYQEEIKRAIENKNFELDPYLKNLALNNIVINDLVVEKKDGKEIIESLTFSILKPVRIKVDGNDKDVRYGGPYKIKLKRNDMYISLLDASSIMGINTQGLMLHVHPHASPVSVSRETLDALYVEGSRSCCLGEAAPYIWKATNAKDLAMTIVNIMIWVTSANSSDYWGRNYVYFPKTIEENTLETSADIAKGILDTINEQEEAFEEVSDDEHVEDYDENDFDHPDYDDEEDEDHQCIEFENGTCVDCGDECRCNDEYDEEGRCLRCGVEDTSRINNRQVTRTEYTPYIVVNNNNNN